MTSSYGLAIDVGGYPPGANGLYDMAGNVWEWVNDWYQEDYYRVSPTDNPQGPASGDYRVLRGGAYHDLDLGVRAAARNHYGPYYWGGDLGFRLAVSP